MALQYHSLTRAKTSDILTINFLLCASDFIILWCLTHRITGVPPSVSVALKIALRSLKHLGITITLAYSS